MYGSRRIGCTVSDRPGIILPNRMHTSQSMDRPMKLYETFYRNSIVRFLNSGAGRLVKAGAGVGLIAWGLALSVDPGRIALIAAGLVFLSAGTLHVCYLGGLLGGPLRWHRSALSTSSS
jgi:hypothetical protein